MRSGVPIGPEDVEDLPGPVVDAWNRCIRAKFRRGEAVVTEPEVLDALVDELGLEGRWEVDSDFLRVEDVFREAGWLVDKVEPGDPDYNEYLATDSKDYWVFRRP